jgi:cystathionine gamma-synthase
LEKFGPGCHFLAHNSTEALGSLIAQERVSSIFTECPSNPLLQTPDFAGLRALADKYDVLLVIDATIGNMCNVEVLPYADIVVHSLSKVFSGAANVTGGRFCCFY